MKLSMSQRRARKAAQNLNEHYEAGQHQQNIVDMLADLMHLCSEKKLNFNDALRSAHGHFIEEVTE